MQFDRELAVQKFREYLQIKSAHPDPDYDSIVKFLLQYATSLGLETKCFEFTKGRKVVVLMTLLGKDPSLPSILLNSHTDVAPVFEEKWKHDPWGAEIDENGDIYGRGTQDMKCVGVQYLEAIRYLKQQQKEKFERTIHLSFVPDEQILGEDGMKAFCQTEDFRALNIGLALDEGLANPEDKYSVFYTERSSWWIRVKCAGNPGNASRFIENNAAAKLRKVINTILDFREVELQKLKAGCCTCLGDVTTVNMTMLNGGVQGNVVPTEFVAVFDARIPPTVNLQKFEDKIKEWCENAGSDVTYEIIQKSPDQTATRADDLDPWWQAMTGAIKSKGVEVVKEVFSAVTDGRFLRELGYPVIGFSPMRNTRVAIHENDEFLNKKVFLEGIEVYCKIIPAMANLKF